MRPDTPNRAPDPDRFRQWKPEAQAKALELLEEAKTSPWKPFYCPISTCDGLPHGEWTHQHARSDQRPPKWTDEWLTWLLAGGRGSGKTRTGSETTHRVTEITPRIILIAATGPDLRDTMVEGVSGLLATAPPGKRPDWEPSKKRLTWPNGCIAEGVSAEEPDRLRGRQSGFIWADEPGHYPLVEEVWSNALLGLRVINKRGLASKVVATSTPKPTRWMKQLLTDPSTVTHRVSTYANLANLDPTFRKVVVDRYEGTRLGRQELHGELLEDVEGALWNWEMFVYVEEAPHLVRIVVAVDPAGSQNRRSDETGVVVLGLGADKKVYILADLTGKYSPNQWAQVAKAAVEDFSADAIVAEKNYGGEMVRATLENSGTDARIILVESRRGKQIRAEPIVALYEKQRVVHVGKRGDLARLEDEQTSWVPGEGDSPNRVDALVHGTTELVKNVAPAQISDPNKLLSGRRHLRAV
jgi:phage terminase large subunit-like protein